MRKGEGLCCSVDCESSESESSREAGRRMVGVMGGGDEEGIVGSRTAGRRVKPEAIDMRLSGYRGAARGAYVVPAQAGAAAGCAQW